MSLPMLLSVPSENGEYQLFSRLQNPIIDPDILNEINVYAISPEEIEKIKNRRIITQLSQCIDSFLEKNKKDSYHLTIYTNLQIDEIETEIYVYLDYHDDPPFSYYYKIISKNIEY